MQCDTCHKWFLIKCVGILTLPTLHEDKWCCSPVYVTEILIYCWIEPFPAFLCTINMYLQRLATISPYEAACLLAQFANQTQCWGEGGGGVTPGLTMALLPLASLWLCMLPLASLWLCYPMQASLWLCHPCMASLYGSPQYGSVTPGLNMDLLPLAYLLFLCVCDRY